MTIEDEYRALFEEMKEAWIDAPPPSRMPVGDWTQSDAANIASVSLVHGWMARIIRTGEVALMASSAGYSHEAAPLIRSMIEHAMSLEWVQDMGGDAVQVLLRRNQREMSKLKEAQSAGWVMGDEETQSLIQREIDRETDETTKHLDELGQTKKRADRYNQGILYQAWLIHTAASHPSVTSANPFSRPVGENEQALSCVPLFDAPHVESTVASVVYFALAIYDRFLPPSPIRERLSEWHIRGAELKVRLEQEMEAGEA